MVLGALFAIRLLVAFDWDPTVFTAFGEDATAITDYAEEKLGRDVLARPQQGHDGKFFFVQANDPWILDPDANAAVLDRPEYRSRRMFYPILAGGLGLFSADVLVWALPLVNIIMLGIGSWAIASIAQRHGAPAWVGVAFALNIGLLSELFIDGAGIVAFALASVGAWALEEDRTVLAAAAFAGAVLSREVMVIFVGFVALGWLIRKRVVPWKATIPAALAIIAWEAYLRLVVDLPHVPDQANALSLIPFKGVWEALTSGRGNVLDFVVIGVFLALLVVVPYRAFRSQVFLTWGAVGFAVLGPFLTESVWQKSFDISRALAPLITVFVLEFFITSNRSQFRDQGVRTGVRL